MIPVYKLGNSEPGSYLGHYGLLCLQVAISFERSSIDAVCTMKVDLGGAIDRYLGIQEQVW